MLETPEKLEPLNFALVGTQWFTRHLLCGLERIGLMPRVVICLSPELGEGISGYEDLKVWCDAKNLKCYCPKTFGLTSDVDKTYLSALGVDALIVFGWPRLIPGWFIDSVGGQAFGVHGSPEKPPRGRGRAVFNWSLILDYKRFYHYLFKLTPQADDGDIVEITEFDITERDDIVSLYHKNCLVTLQVLKKYLPDILNRSVRTVRQLKGTVTVLPGRIPEHGGIFWQDTAVRIANLVRSLTYPYPGAFSTLHGQTVRIWDAHVFDSKLKFEGIPGTIMDVFSYGHFLVQTGGGGLYVRKALLPDGAELVKGDCFEMESGVRIVDPVI